MNASNDGSESERPRATKPPSLPNIKSAIARRTRFEQPRRFLVAGKEITDREGIEIDVETDADFPTAGVGPAIFVGKVPIVDSLRLGERRYRFFAPSSFLLVKNASLALGRAGSGAPKAGKRSTVRLRVEG